MIVYCEYKLISSCILTGWGPHHDPCMDLCNTFIQMTISLLYLFKDKKYLYHNH